MGCRMPLTPALPRTLEINFLLGLVTRMDVGLVARNGKPPKRISVNTLSTLLPKLWAAILSSNY